MKRMIWLWVVAPLVWSGCGLAQMGRDTARMFTPNTGDYSSDVDDGQFQDEWSVAGREGRGETKLDRESDGLTPYLSSDKARRIARNLGTDSP